MSHIGIRCICKIKAASIYIHGYFVPKTFFDSGYLFQNVQKPTVTEIRVRMDCNGCVQKIKKALHGIIGSQLRVLISSLFSRYYAQHHLTKCLYMAGIYDLYIDFPQQKITIIGWADPEKIVKAIKKTRKTAIICSHTEQSDQPAQQTEPAPEGGTSEGGAPPPESTNPPTEQPQTEAVPSEAPKESPPLPENRPPEEKPSPESANERTSQSTPPSKPKELEEIHVINHHPPDYGYRYAHDHYHQQGNGGQWNAYSTGPGFREPPQPIYVTHSYNTYKPSPYVTEYAYPQSPLGCLHHSRPDYYSGNNGNGNGNITSLFSEENPNACSIV